jgi:hypothetical protein
MGAALSSSVSALIDASAACRALSAALKALFHVGLVLDLDRFG